MFLKNRFFHFSNNFEKNKNKYDHNRKILIPELQCVG